MGKCKLNPGLAESCGCRGGTFGIPMPAVIDADDVNRLWRKRLHQ
jgi:hypothetical protein